MAHNVPLWTIDELGMQVALALAVDYAGAPNGRVRGVPDQRTIRYYTTLGLLDRPAEMRGRTALYKRRHLLQLVAIKRLQARGEALADIQQRLLGATNSALERIAQLPEQTEDSDTGQVASQRDESFWKTSPAVGAAQDRGEAGALASGQRVVLSPCQLVTLSLADAVTLTLAAGRPLDADDLEAIRTVAAPLLKLLDKRRLLARAEKGPSDDQAASAPQ